MGQVWGQLGPGSCHGAGESQGQGAWCGAGWGTHHALAAGAPGHEAFAVAVPADGVTGGAARHRAPRVTPARCAHTRTPSREGLPCGTTAHGLHGPPSPSRVLPFLTLSSPSLSPFLHPRPSIHVPPSLSLHPRPSIPVPPSLFLHPHPSTPHPSIPHLSTSPPTSLHSPSLHPTSLHPSIPVPPLHIPPCPSLGPSSRWQPCGSPWLRP